MTLEKHSPRFSHVMFRSRPTTRTTNIPGSGSLSVGLLCLAAIQIFVPGCDSSAKQPSVVVKEAPIEEFEWGMTLLKRILRLSRPKGVEGINVTNREIQHELFPPSDKNPNYTAVVTVVSKTNFLPGKFAREKQETPEAAKEFTIDDPLAEKDDYSEYIKIAGTGPGTKPRARIETRSLDNKSVFEMTYLDGHWKLDKQPAKKHEQLWFEYAFD